MKDIKHVKIERNENMFLGISMWSFHKEAFAGKMSFQDFILYSCNEGYEGVELLDCFWKEAKDEIGKA